MSIDAIFKTPPIGSPGSEADTGMPDNVSITLEDDVLPGTFVTQGSVDRTGALINAATDILLALVMKTEHVSRRDTTDDGAYKDGLTVPGKKTGRAHVLVDGAFGPALPVYVRYIAISDEAVGTLSSVHDAGKNRLVPPQAIKWVTSGTDEIAEIELHLHDDEVDPAAT